MFSSICALVLSILVWYSLYVWRRLRLIRLVNKFDGPPTLPVFGNALQFSGNPKDVLQEAMRIKQKYKNPYRIWIFNKPYIFVTSPEDFQIVASKALEKDNNYGFIVDMLGDGIFTSRVSKWKNHRQLLNSAFNPVILSDFFLDVFNNQNKKLIQHLEEQADTGEYFDIWPYMILSSINSISETALGREEEFPESRTVKFGEAVLKSAELVSQRFCQPWLHISAIFTVYKYFKGYKNIFKLVHEYPLEILQSKRKKLDLEQFSTIKKSSKTFISILLESHEKQILTDKEIKDEVVSIMFGGSETTSVTNCFLLLMLAIRQDIQDKVYEEVHDVFGDSDCFPTSSDLSKLHYLEQCIKETLRRFPVVPAVFRYATDDIQLSGKGIIPSGASIILPIIMLHHDSSIYPNPFEWNPSNFDADRVAKRRGCTFVPFSSGPRGCIGQKYAYVSMKAQISTILRHFRVTTSTKMEEVDFDMDLIIRSDRGYPVKLERRHRK